MEVDNEGSIKIRRPGRDDDLADIAIALNLGCNNSRASQESALGVFSALCDELLRAGVALVGYVSGLSQANDSGTASDKPDDQKSVFETSLLQEAIFSSYSAVLEVLQTDREPLRLTGSPLLVSRAKKHAQPPLSVITTLSRVKMPWLRIQGPSAQQVALDTIRDYSKYVAALFENFD